MPRFAALIWTCVTAAHAFTHGGMRGVHLHPHFTNSPSLLCSSPAITSQFYTHKGATALNTKSQSSADGDVAASAIVRKQAAEPLESFDDVNVHHMEQKRPLFKYLARTVFSFLAAVSISSFSPSVSAMGRSETVSLEGLVQSRSRVLFTSKNAEVGKGNENVPETSPGKHKYNDAHVQTDDLMASLSLSPSPAHALTNDADSLLETRRGVRVAVGVAGVAVATGVAGVSVKALRRTAPERDSAERKTSSNPASSMLLAAAQKEAAAARETSVAAQKLVAETVQEAHTHRAKERLLESQMEATERTTQALPTLQGQQRDIEKQMKKKLEEADAELEKVREEAAQLQLELQGKLDKLTQSANELETNLVHQREIFETERATLQNKLQEQQRKGARTEEVAVGRDEETARENERMRDSEREKELLQQKVGELERQFEADRTVFEEQQVSLHQLRTKSEQERNELQHQVAILTQQQQQQQRQQTLEAEQELVFELAKKRQDETAREQTAALFAQLDTLETKLEQVETSKTENADADAAIELDRSTQEKEKTFQLQAKPVLQTTVPADKGQSQLAEKDELVLSLQNELSRERSRVYLIVQIAQLALENDLLTVNLKRGSRQSRLLDLENDLLTGHTVLQTHRARLVPTDRT